MAADHDLLAERYGDLVAIAAEAHAPPVQLPPRREMPVEVEQARHRRELLDALPGARPASAGLDWRRHQVGRRRGACRICARPALLRDENGEPCHKVCAEAEWTRIAAAAATAYKQRSL